MQALTKFAQIENFKSLETKHATFCLLKVDLKKQCLERWLCRSSIVEKISSGEATS